MQLHVGRNLTILFHHIVIISYAACVLSIKDNNVWSFHATGQVRWGKENTSATLQAVKRPSERPPCCELMSGCTQEKDPSCAAGFSAENDSRAAMNCSDTPGHTQVCQIHTHDKHLSGYCNACMF